MLEKGIDLWWAIVVGTAVLLALVAGLISVFLVYHREKSNLERESERKYTNLFNNVTDLIYFHSLDGTILDINDTVTRVLGLKRNDLIGHPMSEFLRHRPRVKSYLRDLLDNGGEVTGIVPIISRKDGKLRIFEYRSSLVLEEGKAASVRGIAWNITDRIIHERSLKRNERRMSLLLKKSQTMQENLARLSREVIRVQENDRQRLSHELHDEVGQLLAAISFNLEIMKQDEFKNLPAVKERVEDSEKLVKAIFERLHLFLRDIRPVSLDEVGLLPTVQHFVDEFTERTGIEVIVTADPGVEESKGDQKVVLYRIIQEGLTNVAKHAQANRVTIEIVREDNSIFADISDDGKGFDVSTEEVAPMDTHKRLGLLGMKERLKLVNGEFILSSAPGRGTSIRIRIPIDEKEDQEAGT